MLFVSTLPSVILCILRVWCGAVRIGSPTWNFDARSMVDVDEQCERHYGRAAPSDPRMYRVVNSGDTAFAKLVLDLGPRRRRACSRRLRVHVLNFLLHFLSFCFSLIRHVYGQDVRSNGTCRCQFKEFLIGIDSTLRPPPNVEFVEGMLHS